MNKSLFSIFQSRLSTAARVPKGVGLLLALIGSILSTACYIAPLQPAQTGPIVLQPQPGGGYSVEAKPTPAPHPISPQVLTIGARLYPENAAAAAMGMAAGTIISHSDGRGTFTFSLKGENFTGEATRRPSSNSGHANAAGNKGSYMQCSYTMYKPNQGEGKCTLNNTAVFTMHIGG